MSAKKTKRSAFRRVVSWTITLAILVAASWYVGHWIWRMGVAADVQEYTPSNVDSLLWIPRVDKAMEKLVAFTKGVPYAQQLKEILKPETGVDLGDKKALREMGIDPEAGLVVFLRNGNVFVLFGVEDGDKFTEALSAKFENTGHPKVRRNENARPDTVIYEVSSRSGSGVHAAFAAEDGLLALVYKGRGDNPVEALKGILTKPSNGGFFKTARFKEIEQNLGKDGILFFANADKFARTSDGKTRTDWLDAVMLDEFKRNSQGEIIKDHRGAPTYNKVTKVINNVVRHRVRAYLSRVDYAATRIQIGPCAASAKWTLKVKDKAELIPAAWIRPSDDKGPDFGRHLPRETILLARSTINLDQLISLASMAQKLMGGPPVISRILGGSGDGTDMISSFLAANVHPELSDRHIIDDVMKHMTGRMAIALVGMKKDAELRDFSQLKRHPWRAVGALKLAVLIHLKEPDKFWNKWWAKRQVLAGAGFEIETKATSQNTRAIEVRRGCSRSVRDRNCRHYGVVLKNDILILTSGAGVVDRVLDVRDTPQAIPAPTISAITAKRPTNLRAITNEPVSTAVLENQPMVFGGFVSTDGLLIAVKNKPLPGGARTFLGLFYELAFTLNSTDGTFGGRLILTR